MDRLLSAIARLRRRLSGAPARKPAEFFVGRYSAVALVAAPSPEGRALRRLDRAERITAAGA